VFSLLRLSVALAVAVAAEAAAARPPLPAVSIKRSGPVYVIDGSYTAACTVSQAWSVLTDYDGISRYVAVVTRSQVLERDGDRVLIDQSGAQKVLGFRHPFHLVLEVREQPRSAVLFRGVNGGEFPVYYGAWQLRPIAGGVEVQYHLRLRPRGDPPAIFARPVLHDGVAHVLDDLRLEMLRRAYAAGSG
jgi:hypothetical protein